MNVMTTDTNRTEEQLDLWDEAERAAADAAALNAAIVRVTENWADVITTAVYQVASAGFGPEQTQQQIRDILLDEAISLLREAAACQYHA
jgi:hypothetical protein